MTPEQYLAIERAAEFRSEYVDGQMCSRAGSSEAHAYLAAAIASELHPALRKSGCRVAGSDLRVRVSERGPYFYPDASVTCGKSATGGESDVALNPVLIVEILSKSTEAFDRGDKFAYYRQIKTLREYVLVSQSRPHVETFLRGPDGHWTFSEFEGLDAVCRFPGVGCEIPMAAIYEGIELAG